MTAEGAPGSYSPFRDVTSKIAFAIAKAESLAVAGLILLLSALALLAIEWGNPLDMAVDGAAAGVAAAIVALIFGRSNLERVNRPAVRGFLALGGLKLVGTVGSHYLLPSARSFLAGDLALIFGVAAVVLSYPLPLRRGSTVLYDPEGVQALADGRARALAGAMVFAFALPLAALGLGGTSAANGALVPVRAWPSIELLIGALCIGAVAAVSPGATRSRLLIVLLAIGGAVAILWVILAPRLELLWAIVPLLAAGGTGLFAPPALGGRLRADKTIVSRRG